MDTNTINRQSRIAEAEKCFNLTFGAVKERKFGYLWTKQDKTTYPFMVSNIDERKAMAIRAIELSDVGFDVYFGVNLMDNPPTKNARVKAEHVTLQTATIADIDILGGEHTDPNKYPANLEVAEGFLPFPVSLKVDSGYGLHPYCIYSEPIVITAENRSDATKRNKKFIDVVRSRAGKYAKAVDSVHDLPRVLRVPGTYNYKCGRENAPLCHIVEVNDLRFSPNELDQKLSEISPTKKSKQGQGDAVLIYQSIDSRDFDTKCSKLFLLPLSAATSGFKSAWLSKTMATTVPSGEIGAAMMNVSKRASAKNSGKALTAPD